MENTIIDQQNAANQIYSFAADMLVRQNKNTYEVKTALLEKGLDENSATAVIDNLEREIEVARKNRANKDMLYGALWCVGGIVVTVVTMSAASGGGRYVVAWGAILFGGVQFVKGLINYSK